MIKSTFRNQKGFGSIFARTKVLCGLVEFFTLSLVVVVVVPFQ